MTASIGTEMTAALETIQYVSGNGKPPAGMGNMWLRIMGTPIIPQRRKTRPPATIPVYLAPFRLMAIKESSSLSIILKISEKDDNTPFLSATSELLCNPHSLKSRLWEENKCLPHPRYVSAVFVSCFGTGKRRSRSGLNTCGMLQVPFLEKPQTPWLLYHLCVSL